MIKTIIGINGMMCGMCESHINDAIRAEFKVKKVRANKNKNQAEIISEDRIDKDKVYDIIKNTGYEVTSFAEEPYEKKSFFSCLK